MRESDAGRNGVGGECGWEAMTGHQEAHIERKVSPLHIIKEKCEGPSFDTISLRQSCTHGFISDDTASALLFFFPTDSVSISPHLSFNLCIIRAYGVVGGRVTKTENSICHETQLVLSRTTHQVILVYFHFSFFQKHKRMLIICNMEVEPPLGANI